jgi:hypothetical protein
VIWTQIAYDVDALTAWADVLRPRGVFERAKVLIGIVPLRTGNGARFMDEKLPGVRVPTQMIEALDAAGDESAAVGVGSHRRRDRGHPLDRRRQRDPPDGHGSRQGRPRRRRACGLVPAAHRGAVTDAPPDLLIRNARAFTVDAERPWTEAIAVCEGRIAWVGDDADASEGPDTEVIDAAGATVLPGFIDTHNHARLGSNPLEVDLAGADSLDEVKTRIRAHADAHPEHTWIEGVGLQLLGDAGRTDAHRPGSGRGHRRPAGLPADV